MKLYKPCLGQTGKKLFPVQQHIPYRPYKGVPPPPPNQDETIPYQEAHAYLARIWEYPSPTRAPQNIGFLNVTSNPCFALVLSHLLFMYLPYQYFT